MSKHYLSKSVLVLSLFAAASGAGLIAKADETPAANDISAASPAASSNTAVADNQGNTALPAPEVPDSAPAQASPTPVQAQTAETSAAEPLPSAEKSAETATNEAAEPAPKVSTPVTAAAPVKEAVKTPDPVEGQTVDMRILSTTDLHTNLVNYDYYQDKVSQTVGLAKTAILIEEARKENSNIVLVDSGDTIQGTPFGTYKALINPVKEGQTHPMYEAFEKLGYDAETLGNHEFNYGLDFLNRMVNTSDVPIINANVRDARTGQYYFQPYIILNKVFTDTAGRQTTVKVGITGVLPRQILVWDKANLEGKVTVDDPVEAVRAIVPSMKDAGADIVLVLAHSGIGDDQYENGEENEGYFLAGIDGVDAVATGHSHADFPNGDGTSFYAKYSGVDDINGLINGKPVVMAGKFGDHLGIMDLTLTYKEGKWQVTSSKSKLRKIDTASPIADQELIDMVKEEHQGTIDYVRQKVGQTTAPINSYFAQVLDDPSIQIVNNAQLWYGKKELAGTADANLPILSAAAPFKAGTRGDASYYTDIPAGALAIKNVADLYLYDNVTAIIKLTGAQIKEWLEMSAGQFNQIDPNKSEPQQLINSNYRSYNFDVIDGLTYQFDVTQPNKYDEEGKLINPAASRVRELKYKGQPIDPNQTFIVISNNYRATGNFPGVRDAAEKRLLNLENRQVIIDYIVSEKTINPSADNNWSFTDSIKGLDIRFLSSENARKYLADHADISYVGSSASQGFGEYRYTYMEPKVPAPANTKPEMTISLTPDRQQDIYNLVAKAYAQTQAAAAKPISTDTSLRTADPAQTSGLQAASKSSLPHTSSSSSVLYSLFGCTFVALAGLFIKKNKKD
ncbi:bifunctional 2',3'-cyclic-nucleotide 2'-phosphodiesterase/3'-nucleotidase [Streptococcus devriesei]|uniref:bifunctional 2',3'-cyclic-nucleotide 2'-phosphodiesterase/3'-nucleotidase n=1 Tax=Streptococcus devriesei TaxID=231233 RepID=UPI0003FF31AC|nr:bifunctional 2',3'-cyclic-nucleotide 2'-phosphodiesterase/3'-nucleotidase [Streptococcus devriesei]